MSLKQNKKPSISELYQVGDFIDAKDNQGDWRVGYIVDKSDITKTFKIRFDGWAVKYDQLYRFGHPKLQQFRFIVNGYTGQKQNPAIRPSWKFTLVQHQKKIVQLSNFVVKNTSQKIKTAHDYNQWIRGHNYFWVDFLMTITYVHKEEVRKVINYFKLNVSLAINYMKNIIQNFQIFLAHIQSTENQHLHDVQIAKSFAFYEIFDMVYTITASYQRLQGFLKENQELLRQCLEVPINKEVKTAYQINIIQFFYKQNGFQFIDKILKIISQRKKPVPFLFLYSLAHLYAGVSCMIQSKSRENIIKQFKQIVDKSIELLQDKQMKDFSQIEVLQLINEIISFSRKSSLQRNVQEWSQRTEMEVYFKMITCPFFQKKLRGITSLHEFIEQRSELIQDSTIVQWIEQKKLFDVLFSNDNPQIIKKSTELIKFLYIKDNSMEKYIQLVWKYRQGKHQTALKQIYNFMGDVPIYDKNQQFTIELFKKHLALVDQNSWNSEYIKMIKDYTSNALYACTNQNIKQTLGFDIIYMYLQKNQGDNTLLSYLIQILEKLEKTQFLEKFVVNCFKKIQNKNNQNLHISLLLKILKQKIADMRSISIDARAIIQENIILSKNQQISNLPEQFELLNDILRQAKQIIPEQDFLIFWNQMVDSKAKVHFLRFLYKVKDTGKVFLTNFINLQTKMHILQNFWTEKYLKKYGNFDQNEATFLLELFKVINTNQEKVKRVGILIQVLDQNLIGLQKLEKLYKFSKNEKATQILSKALAEIYMSGSSELNGQDNDLVEKFIQKIVIQIQEFSEQNNIEGTKKMVRLLQELILRDQQIFDTTKIIVRNFSFKDFSIKNIMTGQQKIIRHNIIQNIYSFKKIIAQKFNTPLHKFDLVINNEIVPQQSYFCSVGQLNIKGKILMKPKNDQKIKFILNHYLDLLFELLGNKQIQQRVWNIVAKLPNSIDISQKIANSGDPLKILQNQSFYKELYMFKVAWALDKKWWDLDVQHMINFFIQRLQKTSASTEIQRQYIMVSGKILEKIVKLDQIQNQKFFNNLFLKIFQITKRVLTQTNNIQNLNPFYVKAFIETFFFVGQSYNEHLEKKSLKVAQLDATSLMLKDQKIEDLFKLCMIEYKHQAIRKQFPIRFAKLAMLNSEKYASKLASIILDDLLDFTVQCETKNLRQYINFSCFIFDRMSNSLSDFYEKANNKYFNKLFKLIESQPNEENSEIVNVQLNCYLSLIRYVVQQVSQRQLEKFFSYIYNECLFKGNQSKCKSKQTRNSVFNIFLKLIRSKKNQEIIVSTFGDLHKSGIWRSRRFQDWVITQSQRLKSSTGYTGLKNLGCICYMNSFFQQIFMIKDFRLALLLSDDPAYHPDQVSENVLYQVKKMFLNLMFSDKKSYNPITFCKSFKDYEGNPTNVSQQMDIDEFSGILFDRLQNSIKGTKYANLIKETFGGVFSNEIICKGCPHFSETEQSFLSLSLTVKDKRSVYQSLDTMIQGDTLDGDNAYHCQRCDKKVSAVKRVCLKSLPDYLIVTLKRFQFDFTTMTKLKINQYCQFPHEINLEEYSYEYLRKKQNPKAFEGEQLKSKKYYQYKLKGVVVHLGYADSGHYYSLIQQQNGQKRWFEFNDTIVRKFNVQNLNDQAFGGQTGGPQSKEKIKNAYMLIYERVQKIHAKRQDIIRKKNTLKAMNMYKDVFSTIDQQNFEYNIQSILFSAQYIKFINSLLEEAKNSKANLQLQKFIILSFLTTIIRCKCEPGPFEILQRIYNSFGRNNTNLNEWILTQFSNLKVFEQFFRSCPLKEQKRTISSWLIQVLKQTKNQNIKINFLKSIVCKITIQNQNTVETLNILHSLAEQDYCFQFLVQNGIIGRLLQNIIRKEPRVFGSIQELKTIENESNQLGYEQIIEKTAFQLKKMKYENDTGIVWALIFRLINRYSISQLQTILHPKQIQYLYLTKEKIYKLLEQVKSKFDIEVLTDYLAYLSYQNLDFSNDLIHMVQRGLVDFNSKRYRQFFVLFNKLISVNDSLIEERVTWIHNVIKSLKHNQQYAMDCTIIQLWICKTVNQHLNLREYLVKEKKILQYLQKLPLTKVPSDQLSKKNANFGQNTVNKLHGIPFPTSRKGYSKILKGVQEFYKKLQKDAYQPINYFESGSNCVYDKLQIGSKIAYFDVKDKVDYQQVTIKDIFIDKLLLAKKGASNKPFWIWIDDQKLTSNQSVIKQDNQHELDSQKTTEMEDEIDFQAVAD